MPEGDHDRGSSGGRQYPLVSTIIPTYNRRDDVRVAIASALAQTYPVQEIIVVDDGSTDDTEAILNREFGAAIRVLRTANRGVSAARNHGVAHSDPASRYLAFLDSDDEWLPDKLAAQVDFLQAHPDFGMVLTDILRVDRQRRPTELVRRREVIPEDGEVLRYVVRDPALSPAPSTVMVTRATWDEVGGFDPSLRTAEDFDFHLRVARHHKIGVIEDALTRCMRGHDGLSSLGQTYHDYLRVIERFVEENRDLLDEDDRREALYRAHLPNVRGLILDGHYAAAIRTAARAWSLAASPAEKIDITRLASLLARNVVARGRDHLRGR